MSQGVTAVRSCLYHTALQPRTMGAPVHRQRPPAPAVDVPYWGERALIALDVFDGNLRRAHTLLAHLHCKGYDTAAGSEKLRTLRNLRGRLAQALTHHRHDLLEQLQGEIGSLTEDLCSAICSFPRHAGRVSASQCNGLRNGSEGSPVGGTTGGPVTGRYATPTGQHA